MQIVPPARFLFFISDMIIDGQTGGRESSQAARQSSKSRTLEFPFWGFSYLDGEEGTGSFRGRPAHLAWVENADQHFSTPFDRLQGGGRRGVVVVVFHRLDLPEDLGRDSAHLCTISI
jgi:hypothetical protein